MLRLPASGNLFLFIVAIVTAACCTKQFDMPNTKEMKTAAELRVLAGRAASTTLPDEAAETLPVPKRFNGRFLIQILFYREFGEPGSRRVEPPDHCMLLDPESGRVLRFWACTPTDLGMDLDAPLIPGAGIRPEMTTDTYVAKEERLMAISQPVWKAFLQGGAEIDPGTRALVREYRELFRATTKSEVARFVVAAAPEFFQWIDTAAE